ncbi:MAG: hypothetical protein NTU98_05415 [Bacteroidetes bacterium]|nr:hypothetical protein [Bacteroidota bacterium]
MHLLRLITLLTLLIYSGSVLKSQVSLTLPALEDSLLSVSRKIQSSGDDSVKQVLNQLFRQTLRNAIGLPGSFTYRFDSLKKLAKLTSPDKSFRIYNWNLPLRDGSNRYFCFLQFQEGDRDGTTSMLELDDCSDTITDPEHRTLSFASWFGALYYKIIPEKTTSGTLYTLLGWQGINGSQMQKIIEVVEFNQLKLPVFGKKVFGKFKDGENKRVIFRYSSLASMAVKYDDQFILTSRKWNVTKKTYDESRSKTRMIVCDRLVALEQNEVSNPLLVPAGDIWDGFIFKNGQWNFIEGVDARNN